MQLTPEQKAKIDAMDYEDLLRQWRFARPGDPRFLGDSGRYWSERMKDLRSRPGGHAAHVEASKRVGWED